MPPLNPKNLLHFSSSDVDVVLAALYSFVESDFSSIWNRKKCRQNKQMAERIIHKFENRDSDFKSGEIELTFVALGFLGDYLEGLPDDEFTPEFRQIASLLPHVQDRFIAIMNSYGFVIPDSDND